jgi:N-acetyl-gamma-glutamyl-phosphate reductase
MIVEVPLHLRLLPTRPKVADLHAALADAYKGRLLVEVASLAEAAAMKSIDAEALKGTNRIKLYVFSNEASGQARLAAVFDNLGKGASGAAVQNLNIMLGLPETTGLV